MSGGARVRLSRWTKHGYDRLFVNGANGHKWGFVNLRTGNPRLEGGLAWPDEIGVAVGKWLRTHGTTEEERRRFATYAARWPTTADQPPAPAPDSNHRAPVEPSQGKAGKRSKRVDDDLASTKPGAAVAAEARRRTTMWSRIGRILGMRTDDTRWRVGARGERLVGRTLWVAQLLGWKTVHAVPLGRGDIDHVLIGPGGCVTINTKHYRGARIRVSTRTVLVRGKPTSWVEQARRESRAASDRLTRVTGRRVEAEPMIVVVAGIHTGLRRRVLGVRVASRRWLLLTLLFRRRRVDRQTQEAIYEAARQRTTWQ